MSIENKVLDFHKSLIKNRESHSIFIKTDDYFIWNIRFTYQTESGLTYKAVSYVKDNSGLQQLQDDQYVKVDHLSDMLRSISDAVILQVHLLEHYQDSIDSLEDELFELKKLRSTPAEIFKFRKNLLKMKKVQMRAVFVLEEFNKSESKLIGDDDEQVEHLIAELGVSARSTTSLLERLDTMFNYHSTIKNDSMNNNLYVLSLLSGIFLPLNLIVGFFGMNTNGMFLSNNQKGTLVVVNILLALFILLVIGLPTLHFLDKKILSRLFGSSGLYSKLSKKLESTSEDFNIFKS